MNTRSYLVLIVAMLIFGFAGAQLAGSVWGYGLEGGIAKGDNSPDDENLVPSVRGNMQLSMAEQLIFRFGIGYTPLKADNVYDAKLIQGDVRLLVRPIQMNLLSPYLYAGIGAAKDLGDSATDIFPVVPFGFGFQTKLSPKFLFELSAGYNLALSDKMDGRIRPDSQPNRYTNKKQDGNFTIMMGLIFTKPYIREKAKVLIIEPEKKQEIMPKADDGDNDGLNDKTEMNEYKTDPKKADTDGDGINDGDEVNERHTDPLVKDTDKDGISDGDEIFKYRSNPLLGDSDNDGLTDNLELTQYKTDLNKADTDDDGLSDGDEITKYRTDPLNKDSDKDGLSDGLEVNNHKTEPNQADTDNDGLNDYLEVSSYRSNPLSIDSDGGGMNDGAEIKVGKNPLDPKDDDPVKLEPVKPVPVPVPVPVSVPKPDTSQKDTDGDGLTDIDEQQKFRTDINKKDTDGDGLSDGEEVNKHRTDPLMSDSDKDGLSDGLEINQYKTDPGKADTDGDGLNDYAELMTHRTDPLKIDTDGGGMNDGAEIQAKKNPLEPKDDLLDMSKGKKVVLEGIVFASGKATIMSESAFILDKVYESLKANPDVNVQILGHTDSVGSDEDNRSLSLRRAQAVKDWLTAKGISSSRIKVSGKGETEPIATNDTSDGRARNRRIEFLVEN